MRGSRPVHRKIKSTKGQATPRATVSTIVSSATGTVVSSGGDDLAAALSRSGEFIITTLDFSSMRNRSSNAAAAGTNIGQPRCPQQYETKSFPVPSAPPLPAKRQEPIAKETEETKPVIMVSGDAEFMDFDHLIANEECPTCLEEYDSENPKIVAACSHHFHLSCIYEWLERSKKCPICSRVLIFKEDY